jgi:hypothetical protein
MDETYCGKSCAECTQKEALNCPGCKIGPGRQFGGECELAQCCRGKGHEVCDTCGFKGNCGTLRSRDYQSENRKRKFESELRQKEAIAKRVPILGKWLWILFWLIVPATIAGIMGIKNVMDVAPGVYMTGQILKAVCAIAYGAILFKLSTEEDRYRTAGICALVSAAASVLVIVIFGAAKAPTWSLIITLPMAIVALVGEYNEYIAHSSVLLGVDNELPEKWTTLWKWYIGCMLGMFGSIIMMLISPILGIIVLLGATIGILVVSIMKLVYLYRTAKVFREYPVENPIEEKTNMYLP